MRVTMILLALTGLTACDRNSESDQTNAPVEPAAITYDGANATAPMALISHGERLSWILGCKSCHNENLQGGNVTAGDPEFGDMYAPNVTLWLPKYGDADLDKLIRHGLPKDGRDLWFMPPENFQYLSDADFAALVAYLRTFKPEGTQLPPIRKGPEFLRLVKEGELEAAVPTVARFRRETPVDLGEQHRLGRYIAMTTCTECHNSKLQGYEDFTPDLDIVGTYDAAELETLLATGKGKSKPDLGLMSVTARHRFAKFTPAERQAVIGYLKARADRRQGTSQADAE